MVRMHLLASLSETLKINMSTVYSILILYVLYIWTTNPVFFQRALQHNKART